VGDLPGGLKPPQLQETWAALDGISDHLGGLSLSLSLHNDLFPLLLGPLDNERRPLGLLLGCLAERECIFFFFLSENGAQVRGAERPLTNLLGLNSLGELGREGEVSLKHEKGNNEQNKNKKLLPRHRKSHNGHILHNEIELLSTLHQALTNKLADLLQWRGRDLQVR